MKKSFYIFLMLCLVYITNNILWGQDKFPSEEFLFDNSTMGREFWVAIPQNEDPAVGLRNIGIEILVSSYKKTTVTMEIKAIGKTIVRQVEPFKVTTFSTKKNDFGFDMEVVEGEQVVFKGIHLTSPDPISVFVINVRQYSGEGYHAIPVSAWGSEYYHCSYYDFYQSNYERGGGFIVLASENSTRVTMNINGVGKEYGETLGKKNIGDVISATLNAGEVYMVRGNGKSLGFYDISGTKITSNKPVGVISFHMRTMIPSLCPDDRDNLSEMLTPVSQWGKDFVTLQFDRTPRGSRKGKGDLFRIVSSQNNTKVKTDWYDENSNIKEGQNNASLPKAGDFREVSPIGQINNSNTKTSVFGVSTWVADKPIQLMQYAFSNPWDGDSKWAPQQVLILPTEQYVSSAIFMTPDETGFSENHLTLFVVGDPNDLEQKLLKSIKYDGVEVFKKDSRFMENIIPGSNNIFWARFQIEKGVHYITSETKFFGYINGFASANSYGWPVAVGTKKLDGNDFLPPQFTISEKCGIFTAEATELRAGGSEFPNHKDEGIRNIFMLENRSTNFALELNEPEKFKPHLMMTKQKFTMRPVDRSKPGHIVFGILDRAGNLLIDSVDYVPQNIVIPKKTIDYGKVRVKTQKKLAFQIENASTRPLVVTDVRIKEGTHFSLNDPNQSKGFTIEPQSQAEIEVIYIPQVESPTFSLKDSMFVTTDCEFYEFYLHGNSVQPAIKVADFDFDSIEVKKEVCMEQQNSLGLKIENTGTDTLIISGVENIAPPFYLENQTPKFPFSIAPKSFLHLKSICFISDIKGEFEQEIVFINDGIGEKSTAKLKARAYEKVDTVSVFDDSGYSDILDINPNPLSGNNLNFRLHYQIDAGIRIDLLDIRGALVANLLELDSYAFAGDYELNLPNLAGAMYILKIQFGAEVIYRKLVKVY